MPRRHSKLRAGFAAGLLALAGCNPAPSSPPDEAAVRAGEQAKLGLMTSLPLYWPLGAGVADLVAGNAVMPWQRQAIAARYRIIPLDTLSPISALMPDAPDIDPLAGIARLAVIQPRGLSPADNAALDLWVRRGGRLLLALDPALTGDYDVPLGDPRRPVDSALIPPVAARWGLAISFDEGQEPAVITSRLGGARLPLALPGRISITDPGAADCALIAAGAAASCRVGKGRVTVLADAALFEHPELAGDNGAGLLAVLSEALE